MSRLEKEQIRALNEGLNDLYEGYKRIVQFLNETVKSSRFDPKSFSIELSEIQRQELSNFITSEIDKIEDAAHELKDVL